MGNVLKKSTLKKIYLQCFTVFFSMRNVYHCGNANARSKNYNLRTAQKTIILFFLFYSMYEIHWMGKSKWSPLLNRTMWMGFMQPAIPSTSIMGAFFTDAGNVTRSKAIWSDSVILTELSMKSMKPHWRKRPSFVRRGTASLKCGGATSQNRKKPIQSWWNSWKRSITSRRLNRETHSLEGEREPRPFTQKLVRMRKAVMWISHPCTQVSTSMECILLVSRRSFISPKTRILVSTLASRKLISWLPSGCTTLFCRSEPAENLLFLSAGHAFNQS